MNTAHFHLGNTFHKMGRLPDAIAEYQASLSIDPGVPEVHYERALKRFRDFAVQRR